LQAEGPAMPSLITFANRTRAGSGMSFSVVIHHHNPGCDPEKSLNFP